LLGEHHELLALDAGNAGVGRGGAAGEQGGGENETGEAGFFMISVLEIVLCAIEIITIGPRIVRSIPPAI